MNYQAKCVLICSETVERRRVRDGHADGQSGVRAPPERAQGDRPVPGQRGEMPRGRGQVSRRGAEDLRGADDRPAEGVQRAARPLQQARVRPSLSA